MLEDDIVKNLEYKNNKSINIGGGGGSLFLSFIIPVYNIEKYLRDCLDSLLTQNISYKEYEIICVNDGSTDGSLDILREYGKKYSNIRIIDKENGGVSVARNEALKMAQGEYLWFVDGDDAIQTNCLKQIFSLVKENQCEVLRFEHKKVDEKFKLSSFSKAEEELTKKDVKQLMIGPCVWHMIVQAELLRKNDITFCEDMAYCEDALFQYYVWLNMRQDRSIHINNVLYYYRNRTSSASHVINVKKITKQVSCFMQIAKIYQQEADKIEDKKKKKATKQRQYLAVMNGLTFMPESSLDKKNVLKKLKEEKLYPFPFLWRHIKESKGIKAKILEFIRNLFKFKCIYFLYYKIAKKKQIIKKHKKSA